MTTLITEFTGDYDFLSNTYPAEIDVSDIMYTNVQEAYDNIMAVAEALVLPKNTAQHVVEQLNRNKYNQMKNLVSSKFFQHDDLQQKLLDTGNTILIYGNTVHDNSLGTCYCTECSHGTSENLLGKILTEVRDEMRNRRRFETLYHEQSRR